MAKTTVTIKWGVAFTHSGKVDLLTYDNRKKARIAYTYMRDNEPARKPRVPFKILIES